MVTRVNSSMAAVVTLSRSYAKPIIAALVCAALAYLLIPVAIRLIGRVQSMISIKMLYAQGYADYKTGQYAEAIQKFTLALKRMPDPQLRAEILADRAVAYHANEESEKAQEDLTSALACNPTPDVALIIYSSRATIFADLNDHVQAISYYTRALDLPFSDNDFHAMILSQRATSHFDLAHYDQSLSDFNAAFALNPQDQYLRAEILAYRAEMKMKMNRTETVLKDLTDALACTFDDLGLRRYIYSIRGDFYGQAGDHTQAAAEYTRALDGPPDDELIVYKRGCCFSVLQKWDDAIRDFTDALCSNFLDKELRAGIFHWRANAYMQRKEFQLAADDLNAAIDCNPSESLKKILFVLRAGVFTKLNRFASEKGASGKSESKSGSSGL
jgi:tetratricopeptide (TPR) repeat protein